jgi:hypothetical protein
VVAVSPAKRRRPAPATRADGTPNTFTHAGRQLAATQAADDRQDAAVERYLDQQEDPIHLDRMQDRYERHLEELAHG